MICPLKNACINCGGKEDFLGCDILIHWCLAQQEQSVKTHTKKLAEGDNGREHYMRIMRSDNR